MSRLIGKFETDFVNGRSRNDNCIIAHEMLIFVKGKKKGNDFSLIINLDLNKVCECDRVRWSFVEEMMKHLDMSESWIWLIMQRIISIVYSILINGEPTRR